MTRSLLSVKGKAACKRPAWPERSKSRLHRCQPAEKPPRQPGVIDQDDALSLGNHDVYIATYAASDNEMKKGPVCGPFVRRCSTALIPMRPRHPRVHRHLGPRR